MNEEFKRLGARHNQCVDSNKDLQNLLEKIISEEGQICPTEVFWQLPITESEIAFEKEQAIKHKKADIRLLKKLLDENPDYAEWL